jgi:hypothetical protein
MKTIKFKVTIGIKESFHDTKEVANIVAFAWQEAAKEVFNSGKPYVSAVVNESISVYNEIWGCPTGGERTVTVSGSANPAFVQNMDEWKKTVIAVVKAVKAKLQQSIVVLEFSEVNDFVYLTD